MKIILLSLCTAVCLNAVTNESQAILGDVAKLRQKYEECRAGQCVVQGIEPKVLAECIAKNKALSQEIAQKSGVIKSLEQTLIARDQKLRETLTRYNALNEQANTAKVSRIERQNLTASLVKAKEENERLLKELKKSAPAQSAVQEKIVYKDRPVVQEKVIEKVVYKDRPVIQEKVVEKVVYQDRAVVKEKVVYKDRPVEKVVYKDRPVIQEKIVTKIIKTPALPEKVSKVVHTPEAKAPITASITPVAKKIGFSSAYRMASNAPIYNAPNGSQVDTWEERRSFTAGNPSSGWVHITGYFVNRVWTAAREDENLWVKESDVIRR
ncbi:MAG: IMCp domain-containing protein [Sulfuricurvum sp.]|uniref:IMCp domain-containing protein n=1 Tax=Sulfuricurvum sp. TaxID=2025608 RepID=UPI0026395860|nr:IMCp domain-containing protein [Sulfuricurvum sp.]MDD5159448.1 IMCp domain-containing protein [Sulfuricurvum sp.]